jgi:hypothetical protein
MLILFLASMLSATGQADAAMPDDIVVTAQRQDCRVRFADRELTDREFDARAKEWAAGKPVRVIARNSTDLKCLSKIAFKLADRGVRLIQFVDPSGKTADKIPTGLGMGAGPGTGSDSMTPTLSVKDAERRFFARRAAQLILEGKCGEARKLVLEAGDLESAAQVAEVCRAP